MLLNRSSVRTSSDAVTRYDWPGNIHELQNLFERAVSTKYFHYASWRTVPPSVELDEFVRAGRRTFFSYWIQLDIIP